MNYYEEFGVQPDATAGQIRQAYKKLARLFHPDSQIDEELKAVAGLQMRRLNGMLDTLLDPEKRRAYDESLGERDRPARLPPPPPYHPSRPSGRPSFAQAALRQWFWILTGLVIAATAVWYAAIRDSALAEVTRVPVYGPPVPTLPASRSAAPVRPRAAPPLTARSKGAETVSHAAIPPAGDGVELNAAPAELPPVKSEGESPDGSVSPLPALGMSFPAPVNTAAKPESSQTILRQPGDSEPQTSWTGSWLYAPQPGDAPDNKLYAPSYIEFMLVEEHGNLIGKYRALYKVPDKALSPEVWFCAEGKAPAGNLAQLAWASDEGAKGGVELVLRSSDLLKVTWWTTAFGRRVGLTSGTATLVRQRTR